MRSARRSSVTGLTAFRSRPSTRAGTAPTRRSASPSRTAAREQRIRWRHRLPREGPVLRHDFLVERARGKRVVHVGFVDELMATKLAAGVWLHGRLAEAAGSIVGLDS